MTTRRVAAILAAVAILLLPAAPSQALPSRADVQQRIEDLETQTSQLDEEYNVARLDLNRVEQKLRDTRTQKADADKRAAALRGTASARAAAVYRVGLPDVLLIFFGSRNASEFSRRMGIVSKVGDWESGVMTSLTIADQRSRYLAESLEKDLVRARSLRDSLASKKKGLESKIAEQKRILDQLSAAERAALAARVTRRIVARPAPAQVIADLPASGSARVAVQTAYDQIGKPYKWGAAGPNSFDCSGLTMYSWARAGVSLPHSSRAQFSATKRVARESLQPGDLVFFGSPIHHVGMYVGNGNMINSPQTGEYVGVRSMNRRDYVGAGRPGV